MKPDGAIRTSLALVGYVWGGAIPLLMLVLFFGLNEWSVRFSELPFMKIHPRFSGGEVIREIEAGGVQYALHRVVTDGLIGKRAEGFLQIDITPGESAVYPIEASFDTDENGTRDFRLRFEHPDNTSPSLEIFAPEIVGLGQHARTADGWIVRLRYKTSL